MRSIFEHDRRVESLSKELDNLEELLSTQCFLDKGNMKSVDAVIDETFIYWPYRGKAITRRQYFYEVGILRNTKLNDEQCLMFFEFVYNFLNWLELIKSSKVALKYYNEYSYEQLLLLFSPIRKQILEVLELCNYQLTKFPDRTFRISKRDEDLESVLQIITDESIKFDLLSYLDFRSKDNLIYKKAIIGRLFIYFEKSENVDKYTNVRCRNGLDTKEIKPFSDFNFICNTFNVRHGKDAGKLKQIDLPENETLELCDIAYYMFLQAIRTNYVVESEVKLSAIKEKYR